MASGARVYDGHLHRFSTVGKVSVKFRFMSLQQKAKKTKRSNFLVDELSKCHKSLLILFIEQVKRFPMRR